MANAKRDENFVTTLLGVSSSDGITPVVVYADPTTHRLLVDTVAYSGAGVPGTTPTAIGQIYVDTNATKVYISTGTVNSGSWTILN